MKISGRRWAQCLAAVVDDFVLECGEDCSAALVGKRLAKHSKVKFPPDAQEHDVANRS